MKTKNKIQSLPLLVLLAAALLTGCGVPAATAAPTTTPTPNPCSPENIKIEAQKVNSFTREFDDASAIAAVSPRNQVAGPIGDLQRIRRDAQDNDVPACLARLKQLQLLNMNTVISTLLAFMGGANQDTTNQGISLARQQHDAYSLELARAFGLTVVVVTPAASGSPSPGVTETPAPTGPFISVPGPTTVNLRHTPSLDAATAGLLQVGATAPALGKTSDGAWLLIDNPNRPGQAAWVYADLVTLSGSLGGLPVTTPAP